MISVGFLLFQSLFLRYQFPTFLLDHINDHRQKKSAPGWGQGGRLASITLFMHSSLRNIFRWYCTDIFSLHSPPSSAIKWAEGGIFYGMSKLSLRTDRAPQLSAAASEPAARLGVSDESTPYLGVRIVWPQAGWPHGPGHRRGQRDRARGDLRLCQRGGKGGHRLLSG